MPSPSVFYLLGYPGTGKASIAQKLCAMNGAELCDSHRWNASIFREYGVSGTKAPPPVALAEAAQLRNMTIQEISSMPEGRFSGAVFTNKLYEGNTADNERFEQVRAMAAAQKAPLLVFRLQCDEDEILKRGTSDGRRQRTKLVDPEPLQAQMRNNILYQPDHHLVADMDVTRLSAQEAATAMLLTERCLDQALTQGISFQELTSTVLGYGKMNGFDPQKIDEAVVGVCTLLLPDRTHARNAVTSKASRSIGGI